VDDAHLLNLGIFAIFLLFERRALVAVILYVSIQRVNFRRARQLIGKQHALKNFFIQSIIKRVK
jgi:hypothetical protein